MLDLREYWDEKEKGLKCWCPAGYHKNDNPYYQEDWLHHHCEHPELAPLGKPDNDGTIDLLCIECGAVLFTVEKFLERLAKEH